MKERLKAPELRFDGFTDDWEERKLGTIVEFFSGLTYSPDNIVPEDGTFVLRSSNVKGGELVNADNVYVDSSVVNSSNVQTGDIVVVVRNGSRDLIGKHAQVKTDMENTVIGAFMTGIRSKESNFINALLDTQQFKIEINKNLGATINQITTGAFKKMLFSVTPNIEEQQKIGSFFKQLDDTISLHQRKLDLLKEQKKGYLQKMFPKNGEKIPELRFSGFTDVWEERKFEDIYNIISGFAFKMSDYTSGGVKIINGEAINHGTVESNNWNYLPNAFLEKYSNFILRTGDIVLGLNRPITNNNLKIAQIPSDLDNSLLYQRAGKVEFLKDVDINFSFQILNNEIYKFVLKEAQGSDQPFISTTKLKKWNFLIPKNELEQQKIGSLFKQMDDTIALHQRKLDLLKEQKKGYLQKMFI